MKYFFALLASIAFLAAAVCPEAFASYNVSNYREDGGAIWVIGGFLKVAPGGELDIESGGSLKIGGTAITATAAEINYIDGLTATASELNILDGATLSTAEANLLDAAPATVTFDISASANANVCRVTINVQDAAGANLTGSDYVLEIWLSDSQYGVGITGTSASGTVTCADHPSNGGEVLTALTAKKHMIAVTEHGTGYVVIEITDTSKTTFYVCVKNPLTGAVTVSPQLEASDYGS